MAYSADRTPQELTALTSLASDDTIIVGDTSDVSEVAKSITKANLEADLTITASQVSDFDTEVANNTAVAANTAKVSNATHTGDVTGATALTIANGVVTEAKLNASVNASLDLADSATQPGDLGALALLDTVGTVQIDNDAVTTAKIADAQLKSLAGLVPGAEGRIVESDGLGGFQMDTATNVVTAAGALMDSEVTNLAQVKAFDTTDYATAAQGTTADSAVQPNTDVTLTDLEITGEIYADAEVDNGNSSTADTINWTTGNFQRSTMTGNCTYTFTAPSGPGRYQLKLIQDGTGSRTATWPAAVKWPGGTAPTLTTAAAGIDIITFYWDGTSYFGVDSLAFA